MGFRLKYDKGVMPLLPIIPGASTVQGSVGSSDIGKLVTGSSNQGLLAIGTTADRAKAAGIFGIVAAVPTATTPDSTTPFYIQPLTPFDVVEADWSTVEKSSGTNLCATSNIGYFFGVSNTTTVAGAGGIDISVNGKSAGTTDGLFFKMLGWSTQNDTIWGLINSSHLLLS